MRVHRDAVCVGVNFAPIATSRIPTRLQPFIAPLVFAAMTVIACGSTLFSGSEVLAGPGTDVTLQFLAWREFGFRELSHGNLALWNPHIFGGAPYFSGFQSALLYPPNWLHLILPLTRAINWLIALHLFAAGYFTYLWCRSRAGIGASIIGGLMFMLGGPVFLHVFAGHLPHVSVLPWVPLIFLAIDRLVARGDMRSVLLGAIVIAMQILAGHPQYVYYTGIIATIYFVASLAVQRPAHWLRSIGAFIGMYAGAVALSAIQLFPGIALTSETVRSGGLSYGMAGTFSFPPENALTAIAPSIFGALTKPGDVFDATRQYFGRTYLWETSAFVSITGLMLAAYGACVMRDRRVRWLLVGMIAICLLLALGRHTPLYWLMYNFVPKYDSFRGTTKFLALAVPFVAMLAAIGFDQLRERVDRRFIFASAAFAVVLCLFAGLIRFTPLWSAILSVIPPPDRTFGDDNEFLIDVPLASYKHFGFLAITSRLAMTKLLLAAIVPAAIALIAIASRFRREAVYLLVPLCAIELGIFARGAHATSPGSLAIPQPWRDVIDRSPPDARFILDGVDMNSPMYFGFDGVWGYDPGVLKRYAELVHFSQAGDASKPSQYIQWRPPRDNTSLIRIRNIFALIRAKAVLSRNPSRPYEEFSWASLPTASLIRNYGVSSERDRILHTIASPQFDPRWNVIVEREPMYIPARGSSIGDVEIVSRSTDSLELRVNLETPAILLITNNFADGWRARSIASTAPQERYEIVPANWAQQSISLASGKHHIVVEYAPLSFRVGRWISMLSIVGIAILTYVDLRRRGAAATV